MPLRAKVAVIGPSESGKTILSNFLADAVLDGRSGDYRPTRGCRILEFELESQDGARSDTTVELWDVSGKTTYEAGWPAITQGLHGVILVFDINKEGQEESLDIWFKRFIKGGGVKSSQCVIFANNPTDAPAERESATLEGPLAKAKLVVTDIGLDGDAVRQAFNNLMVNVKALVMKQREAAEADVMKSLN